MGFWWYKPKNTQNDYITTIYSAITYSIFTEQVRRQN